MGEHDIKKGYGSCDVRQREKIKLIQTLSQEHGRTKVFLTRQVTYLKDVGQKLVQIQGNNQVSMVGDILSEPLVVKLVDRNNLAIIDRAVTFKVTEGDGFVTDLPRQGRDLTVISNEQGLAEVSFQIGKRQGAGNHQVTAASIGFPGQIIFSASAQALSPTEIRAARGSYQMGASGNILPDPLVARVTDTNGNPVVGVDVNFTANNSIGQFVDAQGTVHASYRATTDIDGHAVISLQLSDAAGSEGVNSHSITAAIEGLPAVGNEGHALFIATSKRPQAIADTTVTGIVLDNSNNPLPDVEVKLSGEHFATLTTATNAQGLFTFTEAPVGTVHVGFDGSTTSREGDWPKLMFEIITISGVENTVGMPVYIPRLDVAGGKLAGGNQEVIIPMAGVEGAEVIIAPNSVTLPDGRTQGVMMFSQVQTDKVPMPAPNGAMFDLAWTLQPSGTHFDPPARIALPNTNAEAPGAELEMFSFDHDLMEWVSIGPGVVSADGSRIVSRQGHGIRHSGWGGAPPPPPPPPTCNVECDDGDECTDDSQYDCGCNNDDVPKRVAEEQIPNNCVEETCGAEPPPIDDLEGDDRECKECSAGSVGNKEDGTIVEGGCKVCENGEASDFGTLTMNVPRDYMCEGETAIFDVERSKDLDLGLVRWTVSNINALYVPSDSRGESVSVQAIKKGTSSLSAILDDNGVACDADARTIEVFPIQVGDLDSLSQCPEGGVQGSRSHEIDGCSGGIAQDPTNYGGLYVPYIKGSQQYNQSSTAFGQPQGNIPITAIGTLNPLACNNHDVCYQTCGETQNTCDRALLADANTTCGAAYPAVCPAGLTIGECEEYVDERELCFDLSARTYDGLVAFGTFAYTERQTQYCLCCEP
jgi:hypothetical protein